jgi:integrase
LSQDLVSPEFSTYLKSIETSRIKSSIERFVRLQNSFETQKAYLNDLNQYFTWLPKELKRSKKTDPLDIALSYRDYLRSFGGKTVLNNSQKAKTSTVHRKLCCLSSFFDFLNEERTRFNKEKLVNPFKKLKRDRVDLKVTKAEALTKSELETLMSYLDGLDDSLVNLRDIALIKLIFSIIIRNKAIINLEGSDFYTKGDQFRIKYIDKGNKHFDEAVHPKVGAAILAYLTAMATEKREVLDDDPLFQPISTYKNQIVNKPLSVNQITNILRRHCKRCGIGEWVTSHCAKATVTSEIVERFGLHMAQRKTKHAKMDQALAYYGKRREREQSVFEGLDYV